MSENITNTKDIPVLAGVPFAPSGMGEHLRCSFRAFQAAGLTASIRDINPPKIRTGSDFDKELRSYLVSRMSAGINLFNINGNEVEGVLNYLKDDIPADSYKIIYPLWELEVYPREWAKQLERFDEIWAPSQFILHSLQKAVSTPVFHMPIATEIKLTSFYGRRYFKIPESSYLFLFFFDLISYIERKNPSAVIEAFEKVCAARPGEDIHLAVKLMSSARSALNTGESLKMAETINQSRYAGRITIIDQLLTDNEIKNLVRCADCFISLHRSEGFGKGAAEAMYLGKPVIATAYGGNLDFMNQDNSLLVPYQLIPVKAGQYLHTEGQVWADPDIHQAQYYMLKLLDDPEYGRQLGQTASRYIRTFFSYRAIGLRYKDRLDEIVRQRRKNNND